MPPDPILGRFDALASRYPEQPLVLSPTRKTSRGDVDGLSREIAGHLRMLAPGSLVALVAANGPGFLAAVIALRRQRLAGLLLESSSPAADRERAARALGATTVLECRTGWPEGADDWSLALVGGVADHVQFPEDVAIVKLTSGSTGSARGVVTTAGQVSADEDALSRTMGLRDGDRILAAIPMSHSYGFSSVALPALVRGWPVVVPEGGHPLAPLEAARLCEATFLPTAPAFLQGLVKLSDPPPCPRTVRLIIAAGAPLAPAVAAQFRERHGLAVHVFYGASECGGICYDREGTAGESGTVGTPVDGVKVTLEPHEGENVVTVRSASVAERYYPQGDSQLEAGCFRTSDRGNFEGESLRLTGRIDGLINVKGKKVDPVEVERVLAEMVGVDEVAVLGVDAPSGGQMVRAVLATNRHLNVADVVAYCRERLADHKVPRSIILLPALPRTARGKLDRSALVALRPDAGGARQRG